MSNFSRITRVSFFHASLTLAPDYHPVEAQLKAYGEHVRQLADDGVDAIYLCGVREDQIERR